MCIDEISTDQLDSEKPLPDIANAEWNGRKITWDELDRFYLKLAEKILTSPPLKKGEENDPNYRLAWLGTAPSMRFLMQGVTSNKKVAQGAHFFKDIKKSCSKSWKATRQFTSKTCTKVQEFWEEHKTEILVGAAIVATAATVTTLVVCTGGVGAESVIALSAATINHLTNDSSAKINPSYWAASSGQNELPFERTIALPETPCPSSHIPLEPTPSPFPPASSLPNVIQLGATPSFEFPKEELKKTIPTDPQATPPLFDFKKPFYPPSYFQHPPELRPQSSTPPSFHIPDPFKANQENPLSTPQKRPWLYDFLKTIGEGSIDPDLLSPELREPLLLGDQNTPARGKWMSNFLEVIGRGMIDADLQNPHVPLPTAELSLPFKTDGSLSTSWRLGGVNGMNTSLETAKKHAAYLNQFIPEKSLDWVYNRTHGPTLDLAEIFTLNYSGISPNTSGLLIENWTKFHEENKDNPKAKYLQFCHSQGAIHTKNSLLNSSQEIRDRVIVVAIAPGAIVPRKLCHQSLDFLRNHFHLLTLSRL